MRCVIKNGTVITDQIIPSGAVVVEDDQVVFIGPEADLGATDAQEIDAAGGFIAPGLIDIHIHGAAGADLMSGSQSDIETVAEHCARHGVTGFLVTTVTASREKTLRVAQAVSKYENSPKGASVLGVHLEGPFLNDARRGAQFAAELRLPDLGEMEELWRILGSRLRLVTLAPELPGADELIDWLRKKAVAMAIGHSDASYEQAISSFRRGISQATHVFNGMRGLHHRDPGVVGAVLDCQHVYAQLIADKVHVHPGAMRVLFKAKGLEQVVLITDSIQAAGLPDGEYTMGDQTIYVRRGEARLATGNLAGSTLTMLQAVRNAVECLDVSLREAFRMASWNPAVSIGLSRRGWLRMGYVADILILNQNLEIKSTIVGGNMVYRQ